MILETEDAEGRLNSADNLINRLNLVTRTNRSAPKMLNETFGIPEPDKSEIRSAVLPPTASELVEDMESKLALGMAYNGASAVLNESVAFLRNSLANVADNPAMLARIATDMNKIVSGINEVRNGGKANHSSNTIIYKPIMMEERNYQVIQVHE